ncbi:MULTISPECIES: hypothetical protein [Sorangium]|uniref:Uncharacterized protein n=1 Tax=Sorangium cellulosum TaxID=56 RepID=A0A4P2QTK8_SORCE|nr:MULTISPECIES: hypothetical protein [Sorangium]AUX33659.1 uncharacterized protein SOCE836_058200 [Sorangium cellulosum]WCQ92970.1 hypothetical protein NQZ70_05716 [Sorangium sp. Soce836]
MGSGNTIGRIVGQTPARAVPVELANPVVQLFQGVERLAPMWRQLEGLVQQLGGGGRGGAPAARGGASGEGTGARGAGDVASPEELAARLTALGRLVRTPAEAMDGPARPDQIRTRRITEEILRQAMEVSGPRGRPVHALALGAARERIEALAGTAPSPAQAAQAVENAATMALMRGANGPVLEMLRSVLAGLQQALRLIQGIPGRNDGAQIRR